jgi:hypothetical protein
MGAGNGIKYINIPYFFTKNTKPKIRLNSGALFGALTFYSVKKTRRQYGFQPKVDLEKRML